MLTEKKKRRNKKFHNDSIFISLPLRTSVSRLGTTTEGGRILTQIHKR